MFLIFQSKIAWGFCHKFCGALRQNFRQNRVLFYYIIPVLTLGATNMSLLRSYLQIVCNSIFDNIFLKTAFILSFPELMLGANNMALLRSCSDLDATPCRKNIAKTILSFFMILRSVAPGNQYDAPTELCLLLCNPIPGKYITKTAQSCLIGIPKYGAPSELFLPLAGFSSLSFRRFDVFRFTVNDQMS